MQRFMAYALLLYVIIFALGMNFVLAGISLGLLGSELLLFAFVTLLPALFLLIYKFRFNISSLEAHERALHVLIYLSLAIAVVVTAVLIVPTIYS
ncbi:MAG: hypothetical protein HY514_03255 [Candidatus Aenigmarchaeota archaeon]|nr:hypothetical protein [Candidatus Aenigmarchaeota archaeon]